MAVNLQQYHADLSDRLELPDRAAASEICRGLTEKIYNSVEALPVDKSEAILQLLRSHRMFDEIRLVADALLQTGHVSPKIYRQYAQALIQNELYTAAIAVLNELVAQTGPGHPEYIEANGLLGRIYKQLYLKTFQSETLIKAIEYYHGVYSADNSNLWHGINVVALSARAKKDNIVLEGFPDFTEIAGIILEDIENKYALQKADAWDFATAAEACIALGKAEEALKWLSGYARMSYCDAFSLASTLRQFEEVWQLDLNSDAGRLLLPVLRAELLKREGSIVTLNADNIKQELDSEQELTKKYKDLMQANDSPDTEMKLEKVFGTDSFQTYNWYITGAQRCLSVARIGKDHTSGLGTGFIIKGSLLKESYGDDFVLLTNAHVVSTNIIDRLIANPIDPEDAVVVFEALSKDDYFENFEMLWSSPIKELDATLLKFSLEGQAKIKELTKDIKLFTISKRLPVVNTPLTEKVYIIGHPNGGTLQLSLQDNLLLDHEDPKIHYRTPTVGGSSGSPVFNQKWDLIGLHHAGSETLRCLNGKEGHYPANEGIWIQSIIKALNEETPQ